MRSKSVLLAVFALALLCAPAAFAKEQYIYSVKFVCGYNPSNVGYASSDNTKREGEPSVKFGNYATEINLIWPEIYVAGNAFVFKHIVLLVEKGLPVGREPKVVNAKQYVDSVQLTSLQGTMDDCNRIWELLYPGVAVPTPMPLLIGYFAITSTHELDVTAVYTAEACSNWSVSPNTLDCLATDGTDKQTGVSVSIDVERIPTRTLLLQ